MTVRHLVLLMLAPTLLVTAGSDRPADAMSGTFSYAGERCHEAVIIFEVEARRVRPYVADDYRVGTLGGEPRVAVNVAGLRCERFTVDGMAVGSWEASPFGVQVRPPDGAMFNNYAVWLPTDNAAVAARFASVGLGARGHVTGLDIETSLGRLGSSSRVRLPWSYSPYELVVTTTGPFSPPFAREFTMYASGARGNVTIAGSITGERFQLGTARLSAEPGSPLAEIIGTDSVIGIGLIATFEFTATAVLE